MQATEPLISAREGAQILQISLATFWRRVADGAIPKPVKISESSRARWPRSEICAVIESAIADRAA